MCDDVVKTSCRFKNVQVHFEKELETEGASDLTPQSKDWSTARAHKIAWTCRWPNEYKISIKGKLNISKLLVYHPFKRHLI